MCHPKPTAAVEEKELVGRVVALSWLGPPLPQAPIRKKAKKNKRQDLSVYGLFWPKKWTLVYETRNGDPGSTQGFEITLQRPLAVTV